MKTHKNEDKTDLTGSASKKMKQARLPFKLLSPKLADAKSNEEKVEKRKTTDNSQTEDTKTANALCDKKAKENAKIEEVIVLEDSVEMTDEFKDKEKATTIASPTTKRRKKTEKDADKSSHKETRKSGRIRKLSAGDNEAQTTKKRLLSPENEGNNKRRKNSETGKGSKEIIQNFGNEDSVGVEDDKDLEKDYKVEVKTLDDGLDSVSVAENLKADLNVKGNKKSDNKSPASSPLKRKSSVKKVKSDKLNSNEEKKQCSNSKDKDVESETDSREIRCSNVGSNNVSVGSSAEAGKDDDDNGNDGDVSMDEVSPKASPENKLDSSKGDLSSPEASGTPTQGGSSKPSTTPKSGNKTPKTRKLTPNQLEKQKESEKKKDEKEKKLLEKERLRKEKEDQLNRMKEEKMKQKLEKDEQKKKEKEEKEELKKKEKEEREKKRLAEIELKNEAKRLKEEERKKQNEAKDEEKRMKEEERRKRDEAKEEEKRKKEAEKRKAAEAFASFFKQKDSGEEADVEMDRDNLNVSVADKFMPFEVKADMRLSNICRRTLDSNLKLILDDKLSTQDVNKNDLYVEMLKSRRHCPLVGEKTWPVIDESDDEVIIIESEVNEDKGIEETAVRKGKKTVEKNRYKAKLLQFQENRRPPYWGTWRKKSTCIKARRPFCLDKAVFEYDVDSDDEWEEEEPGESLRGSDDENEKEESEDEYEVDNKVFVPHGYLSDEEMQEDFEDCSREAQKAKLQLLEIEFQAEMSQKTEKLKPRLIGCVWFENSVANPSSVGSRIAEMLLSRRMVLCDSSIELPIEVSRSSDSTPVPSPLADQAGRKSKFPDSEMPMLIKLLHGNPNKLSFLVREFSSYLTKNCSSTLDVPSMTGIKKKCRHIAKWMPFFAEDNSSAPMAGKMCWYVSKDIREKYEIASDMSASPWVYILQPPKKMSISTMDQPTIEQTPKPANSITKFTKKMTEEERKKQLLLSSSDNSPTISESPSSSTSTKKSRSQKPANLLTTFIGLKNNSTPKKSSQQDGDVIVISPEKTPNKDSNSVSSESNVTAKDTNPLVSSSTNKPVVTKKRVQLTTLSTFASSSSASKQMDCSNKHLTTPTASSTSALKQSDCSTKKPATPSIFKGTSKSGKSPDGSTRKCSENIGADVSKSPEVFQNEDTQKTPNSSPKQGRGQGRGSASRTSGNSVKSPEPESSGSFRGRGRGGPASKSINKTSGEKPTSAKKLSPLFAGKKLKTDDDSDKSSTIKSFCAVDKSVLDSSKVDHSSSKSIDLEAPVSSSTVPDCPKVEGVSSISNSDDIVQPLETDIAGLRKRSNEVDDDKALEGDFGAKLPSTPSSPSHTPAKKRVKLTTISPPKWRVKLSKPKLPVDCQAVDDDDDVIVIN